MVKRCWSLGWSRYTKRNEIHANPYLTTFIIRCDSEEACQKQLTRLKEHLEKSWVWMPMEIDFGEALEAYKDGKRILCMADGFENLIIRCNNKSQNREIHDLFDIYDFAATLDIVFIGEVEHGVKTFKLRGFEYWGTVYCGYVEKDDFDLYPTKFYELREDKLLIAKALVSYYNIEMTESAPTIELLEVRGPNQGSGIGRKLVRFIEREARKEGFDRIWATDAGTSIRFWKKLGYEIDLDECVKYLY